MFDIPYNPYELCRIIERVGSRYSAYIPIEEPDIPTINSTGLFALGDRTVRRLGYGAMQLAGPGVFGLPRDTEAAIAVLREAVASGVNHIDTSDYYGPHITNQLIRKALTPYRDDLTSVTKIGARRGTDGSWLRATSPQELTQAVHDNLRNLGLEVLDVVNLRSLNRQSRDQRDSVCSLFSAGWLQSTAIIHLVGCRPTPRRDGHAGCTHMVTSPRTQHSANPRHFLERALARKPRCCRVGFAAGSPGGLGQGHTTSRTNTGPPQLREIYLTAIRRRSRSNAPAYFQHHRDGTDVISSWFSFDTCVTSYARNVPRRVIYGG